MSILDEATNPVDLRRQQHKASDFDCRICFMEDRRDKYGSGAGTSSQQRVALRHHLMIEHPEWMEWARLAGRADGE